MLVYITAIGSGNTLSYPIGKNYDGIIALAEKSQTYGLKYHGAKVDQDEHFHLIYNKANFQIKELIILEEEDSTYTIGHKILTQIFELMKTYPDIQFHIELAAGYKMLAHILNLLSHIISDNVQMISFAKHDQSLEILPCINLGLSPRTLEVLDGYYQGTKNSLWNGKISKNDFVFDYQDHKNYLYRIINDLKRMGLINENNRVTDFGKLFIHFRIKHMKTYKGKIK